MPDSQTPPPARLILDCAGRRLDLSYPRVMGILNVTPDSFSDGGRFAAVEEAVSRGIQMYREGAAIIDVGGQSTRPGAAAVSVDEELGRVVPVIQALARELPIPISVDTSKPEVMRSAVAAGAGFINDVFALRQAGALQAAATLGVPVCLMHMQGQPRTMQQQPVYQDVSSEVLEFLRTRIRNCIAAGMQAQRLLIDPGFGFGKTLQHNLALMHDLQQFISSGNPVLVGVSRKSMIGQLLEADVDERLWGSLGLAVYSAMQGAALLRVHDVRPTVDALKVVHAVQTIKNGQQV